MKRMFTILAAGLVYGGCDGQPTEAYPDLENRAHRLVLFLEQGATAIGARGSVSGWRPALIPP